MRLRPDDLFDRSVLGEYAVAIAAADPLSPDWTDRIAKRFDEISSTLWASLCDRFDAADPPSVILANGHALAGTNLLRLSALLRATRTHAGAVDVRWTGAVARLDDAARRAHAAAEPPHWSECLLGVPLRSRCARPIRRVPIATSARYAIAGDLFDGQAHPLALLGRHGRLPHLSRHAFARELRGAVARHPGPLPKLSVDEFESLNPYQRLVLATNPDLAGLFLPESLSRSRWNPRRILDEASTDSARLAVLRGFLRRVRERDFASADEIAARIDVAAELRIAGRGLAGAAAAAIDDPTRSRTLDEFPSARTARLLARLRGAGKLPPWFTSSRQVFGRLATRGRIDPASMPALDAYGIRRSWDRRQVGTLIANGRYAWIPKLPSDPTDRELTAAVRHDQAGGGQSPEIHAWIHTHLSRPERGALLVRLLRAGFASGIARTAARVVRTLDRADRTAVLAAGGPVVVRRAIGRTERGEAVASIEPVLDAYAHLAPRRRTADLAVAIAQPLCEALACAMREHDKAPWAGRNEAHRLMRLANRFVGLDDTSARACAEFLPADVAASIAASSESGRQPSPVAETIRARVDPDRLAQGALDHWIGRRNAARVLEVLAAHPALLASIEPARWARPGRDETADALAVSILANRRDSAELRRLGARAGWSEFESALRKACAALPARSAVRGYLELVATIGPAGQRLLAVALAKMDRTAASGTKLDACYRRFTLPKDAGGRRPIAAPEPWLKRLQRIVLERVLMPLGAHPAAHGFVRGRSIVTNAQVHVGKPVVVNGDISSCFPSVRWSLVLAALRRDLRERTSPAAISLLVDLCTFESALPIGAPTSPALLNRVLLRTDVVLSDAARAKGCAYSRYADDLTFSGGDDAVGLLAIARRTLKPIGLAFDEKKTGIYRHGRRQVVTGLAVNARVSVPRRLRRRMRAAVHAVEQGRMPTWHGREDSRQALEGRISFLRSVNAEEGEALAARLEEVAIE